MSCSPLAATVVLLAGFSSRMGRPKQHVPLGNRTFLEHILNTLGGVADRLGPRLFVGQAEDAAAREQVTAAEGQWIDNPRPEDGPLSSIRLALPHIPRDLGFLLWPVDHPLVRPATIEALLNDLRTHRQALVIPSFGGRRGHPCYFPPDLRDDLLAGPLEGGARWAVQRHEQRIRYVVTDDHWVRQNINTPELLAEAEAWWQEPRS